MISGEKTLGLEAVVDTLVPVLLFTVCDLRWACSLQASLLTCGMTRRPSETPSSSQCLCSHLQI